jgi:hypothetical protein
MGATSLEALLTAYPPGESADFTVEINNQQPTTVILPTISLHCENPHCERVQLFSPNPAKIALIWGRPANEFIAYTCRNCSESLKLFALHFTRQSENPVKCLKIGEFPPFGPPLPAKLVTLIGPDRDMLLKARRAENHGMGIGAYAYYRRIVERQKDRIFDKVISISKRLGLVEELVRELELAKSETQFTKAVDQIKLAIPDVLRINGQNPLKLLHSALSEGIHAQDDATCLELAHDVRVVLTELAERMAQALKDEHELGEAVKRLSSKKAPPAAEGSPKAKA